MVNWSPDDVLSVTELTRRLKRTVESNFVGLWVAGEITDFTRSAAGHLYFALCDEESQLRAVVWRSTAQRLKFAMEEGLAVVCQGDINLYPPRGTYQLVINRIEPVGLGAQQLAFQQLFQRLKTEGLFDDDHKQPIPRFPRRIGVVTSPAGAALHDVWQVIYRRWQDVELLVFPSQVQGDTAPAQLCAAIRLAQKVRPALDLLIVTRGGGSAEELWCFNDERLVREIYSCQLPVISAVGHEVDVTLCDLVADLRALTPSQAGELAVPDGMALESQLLQSTSRLRSTLTSRLELARRRLNGLENRPWLIRPFDRVLTLAQKCDDLERRVVRAIGNRTERSRARISELAARLDAISPLNVLARGYSLTRDGSGTLLLRANDVAVGATIETRLHSGTLISEVRQKRD